MLTEPLFKCNSSDGHLFSLISCEVLVMAKLSKEEAIRIVIECARKYERNLVDKSMLFILMDKNRNISWVEVSFYRQNFLHLTGLKIDKSNMSAEQFYQNCIDRRLSKDSFRISEDGTTQLKLRVLPFLMEKDLHANSFGQFAGTGIQLYTEKLAGGVKGCLGFIKDASSGVWVPNTLLNEDIRKISKNPLRIIATYRKAQSEKQYKEIVHKAKKIEWDKLIYPESLKLHILC